MRLSPKHLAGRDSGAPADAVLLFWRVAVGSFLIWGVSDNLTSPAHMAQFATFLEGHGFPYATLLAPLSVWAQAICGLAFIFGVFTRAAGAVCAINFIVAVCMVDAKLGLRGAFPAAMLVGFGLYIAAKGPGRFSIDSRLTAEREPHARVAVQS